MKIVQAGDGVNKPVKGDTVGLWYSGYLFAAQTPENKGDMFDTSESRHQDFVTTLGHGEVIQGWEEGILQMSLGERATMIVSSDYAYGERGFPGLIPPDSALIFDLKLNVINDMKAEKGAN